MNDAAVSAPRRLFLGLMSGTSTDAVDAVLIACTAERFTQVVGARSQPYPAALRQTLDALTRARDHTSLGAIAELDAAIANAFADSAEALLQDLGIAATAVCAIGSHGQTVFHRGGERALSLQLGDPGRIAARLGITVVGDFRRRDIALGGQGAPLVPAFHHAVFATDTEVRAVLNLGGIANLTLLPDTASATVRGFDTGPANALLDDWTQRHWGAPYDRDGARAASGHIDPILLQKLLGAAYFQAPPPKSTGRGDFHLTWLEQQATDLHARKPEDVLATLAELTARSIAEALQRHQADTARLLVCGGGIRNLDLMARLRRALDAGGMAIPVDSTAAYGLDPQCVEGAAFAWLAMRALDGRTGNLPAVTGARHAAVLGGIYPATR